MIRFFQINVPERFFLLIILAAGLQVWLQWAPLPMADPPIEWMVLGHQINLGKWLYVDLWHFEAPLSALFYALLDLIATKSLLAHQIAASLFWVAEGLLLTRILNRNGAFEEANYVPGLLFFLLSLVSPDFAYCSPPLIANFFLLLAFNKALGQLREESYDDELFLLGLYLALAGLCYVPALGFIVPTFLAFLFYSATKARQYALILFGYLLPQVLMFMAYFWIGYSDTLLSNLVTPYLAFLHVSRFGLWAFLLVFAGVLLFLLLAIFRLNTYSRLFFYQSYFTSLGYLWLLTGLGLSWFYPHQRPYTLIVCLPAAVLLLSHYFLTFQKTWRAELAFLLFAALVAGNLFALRKGWYHKMNWPIELPFNTAYNKLPEVEKKNPKSLWLVKGPHPLYLKHNFASPYLLPQLSSRHLQNLEAYPSLVNLYKNIRYDPPHLVIDHKQQFRKALQRMPVLQRSYDYEGQGIYRYRSKE